MRGAFERLEQIRNAIVAQPGGQPDGWSKDFPTEGNQRGELAFSLRNTTAPGCGFARQPFPSEGDS